MSEQSFPGRIRATINGARGEWTTFADASEADAWIGSIRTDAERLGYRVYFETEYDDTAARDAEIARIRANREANPGHPVNVLREVVSAGEPIAAQDAPTVCPDCGSSDVYSREGSYSCRSCAHGWTDPRPMGKHEAAAIAAETVCPCGHTSASEHYQSVSDELAGKVARESSSAPFTDSGIVSPAVDDPDAPIKRAVSAVADALRDGTNGLRGPKTGTCAVLPRRIIFPPISGSGWDRTAVQALADTLAPVLAVHGVALDGPIFAPDGYGAAVGLYWVDVRAIGTRGLSPVFVAVAGEEIEDR